MVARRHSLTTSSLPLQILLYYNYYFAWFFLVVGALLFLYKGDTLPYPNDVLALEVVGLVLLFLVDMARLVIGTKGNKLQRAGTVLWFILLSIPSFVGALYFAVWQTYITRFDLILSVIALLFVGGEIVLGILASLVFWSARKRRVQ